MAFNDILTKAAKTWYGAELAESLTYNGAEVLGHIERTGGESDADGRRQTGLAHVKKADVAAPEYRDVIVDEDGNSWRVIPPVPEKATAVDWTLNIESAVRPGFGG